MDYTCPRCKGIGTYQSWMGNRDCDICKKTGKVTIDKQAIIQACLSTRGKNKGMLKTVKPAPQKHNYPFGASYTWRMARFHSGQDMTMPVTAYFDDGFPAIIDKNSKEILDILDEISFEIAEKYTPQKSSIRAASVWGKALGYI